MAIKSRLLRSLALALPLFIALASFAEAQSAGYFLDPNSEEPRFIQRFVWSGGEYTLRYEIIIERQEGRTFRRHTQRFTTDTFIEVSLPPGRYRYCVIPYDILNRPSDGTDWVNIEVRHALKPELIDFSQDNFKENGKTIILFDIYADNIDMDAEIFLREKNGKPVAPDEIEFFDDGGFRLFFDSRLLKETEYEVYVKNPGGLENSLGIVYVEPESPFKINIGAAWMPMFRIYGDTADWDMTLFGAGVRLSLAFNFSAFYIGPELTASFFMIPGITHFAGGQTLGADFGLLFGKQMPNKKTAFHLRLGGGYSMLLGQEELLFYFRAYTGVSFFWRVARNLFFEIGADYTHCFNDDFSGFMRPWVGLGVQF
jgi:hypothetical protein